METQAVAILLCLGAVLGLFVAGLLGHVFGPKERKSFSITPDNTGKVKYHIQILQGKEVVSSDFNAWNLELDSENPSVICYSSDLSGRSKVIIVLGDNERAEICALATT